MKDYQKSDWKLMKDFLLKRIVGPWKSPSYVLYFLIVIILVGTFGVLKDLIENKWCLNCNLDYEKVKNFSFNVTNISLSLVTASVIDLIFITRKTIKKEAHENTSSLKIDNTKKSIRIFGLCSLIIIFVAWILVNNFIEKNYIKIILSILSLLFSYLIWWVSNVRNKKFSSFKTDFLDTIGGPLTISGSLNNETSNSSETINELNGENDTLNGNLSNFNTGK